MLPWLYLQNLHLSESIMEVISIQEIIFANLVLPINSTIENFGELIVERKCQHLLLGKGEATVSR